MIVYANNLKKIRSRSYKEKYMDILLFLLIIFIIICGFIQVMAIAMPMWGIYGTIIALFIYSLIFVPMLIFIKRNI